jgi:NitT/TauT family transport system substrate-binding protein
MDRRSLLAALAALATSRALPARAADLPSVAVGVVPVDAASEVYVAAQEGFFERAGLRAAIQAMPNGGAISAALVGGALDIGSVNIVSLAAAHEKNVPLKILAPGSIYTAKAPTSALIAAQNSPLRSARDLNGKTVATNALRGLAQIAGNAFVDRAGGDAKTLHWIEMPFAAMPAALAAGRIDAAVVQEPALTQSRNDARIIGNVYDGIGESWMIDAWIASETWIAAHPDLAAHFAAAMRQAGAWANANRAKTLPIVADNLKLTPDVAQAMRRATFLESVDVKLAQAPIDAAFRYGVLTTKVGAADLFSPVALK